MKSVSKLFVLLGLTFGFAAAVAAQTTNPATLPAVTGRPVELDDAIKFAGPQAGQTAGRSKNTYQQVLEVEGKPLPIFGGKLELYFGPSGQLMTFRDNTVSLKGKKVVGLPSQLTCADAIALASKQLGLRANFAIGCEIGLKMIDEPAGKGNAFVAAKILQPAGAGHEPIEIYVAAGTKEIIAIQ